MGLFYFDEGVNPQAARRAGISVSKTMAYNKRRGQKEREYYEQHPKPGKTATQQYIDSFDHKFRHSY